MVVQHILTHLEKKKLMHPRTLLLELCIVRWFARFCLFLYPFLCLHQFLGSEIIVSEQSCFPDDPSSFFGQFGIVQLRLGRRFLWLRLRIWRDNRLIDCCCAPGQHGWRPQQYIVDDVAHTLAVPEVP